MRSNRKIIILLLLTFQFLPFMGIAENAVMGACQAKASKESVLYDRKLNGRRATPELQLNNAGVYRKNGLDIVQKLSLIHI